MQWLLSLYLSSERVQSENMSLPIVPAQASVCLYFHLSGREFDIKNLSGREGLRSWTCSLQAILPSQAPETPRQLPISFMELNSYVPYVWLELTTPKLRELISWDPALRISFFLFASSPLVSGGLDATIGFDRSTSDGWDISSPKLYIGFVK